MSDIMCNIFHCLTILKFLKYCGAGKNSLSIIAVNSLIICEVEEKLISFTQLIDDRVNKHTT